MPRPSATAAPVTPPLAQPASPPPATRHRGNPNLALIQRCGARTRAGCPCRAPAIHGKLRCRMHGGRSTGPRTPEGRARIAAARTIHGKYGAETRAFNRHHVTFLRRSPVRMFAVIHRDRLPPELAARMNRLAPELLWPPRPTGGITRAEDRAMLLAETAALAPWKQAMALDRQARREERAARAAASDAEAPSQATPHAPEPAAGAAAPASTPPPAALVPARPEPHAPIPPASAGPKPQPAPAGARAVPLAKPHAPERAPRGIRGALARPCPAGRPEAHAPIPATPAQLAPQPTPARTRVELAAKPHAPNRVASGARSAPAVARVAELPKAHAPIHPAPTQPASQPAAAGTGVEPATKPLAPNNDVDGIHAAPTAARLTARPEVHAAERARNGHTGSRTMPAGLAARRWLRQQKLMHRNQPEGPRP